MPRTPTSEEREIGLRIRVYRVASGLSQTKLGEKINKSFQMVQKYEKGQCRVSAGVLLKIAQALGIDIVQLIDPNETSLPDVRRNTTSVMRFIKEYQGLTHAQKNVVREYIATLAKANGTISAAAAE